MILIVGYGSMGKRYACICRHLGIPFKVFDDPRGTNAHMVTSMKCDKAIIATPTRTHWRMAKYLMNEETPCLIEKPMSQDVAECAWLSEHRMAPLCNVVNNWEHAIFNNLTDMEDVERISYDYYHTGSDGILWDCCQLIYLADALKCQLRVRRQSPRWNCTIDMKDASVSLSLGDIHQSYVSMVKSFWTGDGFRMMSLKDGMTMTRLVHKLFQKGHDNEKDFLFNPSTDELTTLSGENLPRAV